MNYYQSGIDVNPLYNQQQYAGAMGGFQQPQRFQTGQLPSYFQGIGQPAMGALNQALAYQGGAANQRAGLDFARQYAQMNNNWLNNAEQGRANMGMQNASWMNQNQGRLYDQQSQMLGGLFRLLSPMMG